MLGAVGIVLVAAGCVWIGVRAVEELRLRVRALNGMLQGLERLEQELELEGPELHGLMARLEQRTEGETRTFFSACRTGLERLEQESFSQLWSRLAEEQIRLGQEGRECLAALGNTLGRCDIPAQCRAVAATRRRLERFRDRAEENCRRQGTLYRVMALSGGAFLIILLL